MFKSFGVFLVALLVAAEADYVFEADSQFRSKQSTQSRSVAYNWDGLGLTADINEYVDTMVGTLGSFLQANNLDPLSIPNIDQTFEVRPVIITYTARLGLTDGTMSGLVNIARSGEQRVHYFAKMLRAQVQLQFTDLEFFFNYLVRVMNIGPSGRVNGTLDRFVVSVDLIIDFNNDELHLQEFQISDVGRIRVSLSGNVLYDWLATPMANAIISIFDDTIMTFVESEVRNFAHLTIADVNANLQKLIRDLEAMNH